MALVHEQSSDGAAAMSTPAGGGSSATQPQGSFSGAIASSPIPSTSIHHHQQQHQHQQQLGHQHHLPQQHHHQTHSHGGGDQRGHHGGYMFHPSAGGRYSGNSNYPQMEAALGDPMTVSESNSHCTALFEKLRMQREQGRYCDLVLSIQGRQFPAHRCVLASCSPWFDSRLKMHKTMKEEIAVECQNLEAFYAVLTYCYTGQISIDKDCVAELLYLADYFAISKLKAYCSDYISRGISLRNVFSVLDLAMKCNASELLKLSSVLILRNFSRIHDRVEMLNLTLNKVQMLLSDRELPQEAVLNFICNWVNYHVASREDHFISLLQYVNWGHVSVSFICDHIDKHPLYQTSPDAMFTILHVVLDRQGIVLGPKYQTAYQNLQEKLLPDQELDELNDSNSFLSIAINSAVKDLEQSEVDPDWFLNEPIRMNPSGVVVPPGGPSPSMQLARQDSSASTSAAAAQLSSVDFEIAEQVINEQQLSEEKNYKYGGGGGPGRDVNAVKRYDPKYRALTEAFRQMEEDNDASAVNHDAAADASAAGVSINEGAVASQNSAAPAVKTSTKEQGLEYYKYPSYTPMGFRPQSEQGVSNADNPGENSFIDVGSKNASQGAQNWQQSPTTVVQVSSGFSTPPQPQRSVSNAPSLPGQYIMPDADYGSGHHRHLGQEGLQGSDGKEKQMQGDPGAVENEIFDLPADRPATPTDPDESLVTPKKMSPLPLPTPTKKRHVSTLCDDYKVTKAEKNTSKNNDMGGEQTQKQHVKKAKLLAEHRSLKPNEQLPQKEQSKNSISEALGDNKDPDKASLCPFCDHSSQSPKQLRGHVRSNHAKLKPPYKCPNCKFSSERLHTLVVHKAEKHAPCPGTKERGRDKQGIENDPVVANNSADIGDGEEESKYSELCCPVQDCGFVGKSKSKLDLHAKLHGRQHSCKECKKSFSTSTALKIHLISHTSDRVFRCPEPGCAFQTKYKSYLTLHGRKHNGKAHVCDFEGCGYTTLKMSLLQCHKRTHTNEKIFVCPECKKGFIENRNLLRHQKTQHSDEKPFSCSLCKFSCKRKDKLKLHVGRMHPTSQESK